MKPKDIKVGDTIKHYQCGELVIAKVIKVIQNGVETEHEPIRWGKDTYTKGYVIKSTPLQFPICETTPKAWDENDKLITVN